MRGSTLHEGTPIHEYLSRSRPPHVPYMEIRLEPKHTFFCTLQCSKELSILAKAPPFFITHRLLFPRNKRVCLTNELWQGFRPPPPDSGLPPPLCTSLSDLLPPGFKPRLQLWGQSRIYTEFPFQTHDHEGAFAPLLSNAFTITPAKLALLFCFAKSICTLFYS